MADTIKEAWLVVTLKDEAGNPANRRFQLKTAAGVWATIFAAASALVADLAAASDAAILDYSVQISYDLETPTSAQTGSEVENTAQISLPLTVAEPDQIQEFGIVNVPAPKIGMFVGATGPAKNLVDMADALVTGLAANFQTAGGAYLSHGQEVAASLTLGSGRRVHRRSSKG